MNWSRQNPFLAGLLGALALGVAVFGWLIFSAHSRNAEIDEAYRAQVNELQRLERLQPYPEEGSRVLLEEKKKEYAAAVTALQAELAREASPPLETSVSPTEFQGRLRETIERLVRDARANNVALPADFYLGFEPYRTGLPTSGAAPLLAFQLKRCEEIARVLLASRIDALTAFKRAPLPDEIAGNSPQPTPTPPTAAAPKPGAPSPAPPLVVTYPVELEFRASPNAFRVVMDELVKSPSFHLVRALRVKNEKEKGPSRDENPAESAAALAAAATPTPTPAPAPASPLPPATGKPAGRGGGGAATASLNVPEPALPERQTLRYVVGMEKVSAALRVETVRFTVPQ